MFVLLVILVAFVHNYNDHLLNIYPIVFCFSFFQDTPGFIVNRLLVPYMMESIRMLERGQNWN